MTDASLPAQIAAAEGEPVTDLDHARYDRDGWMESALRAQEAVAELQARLAAAESARDAAQATNRDLHRRLQATEGPTIRRAEKAEAAAEFWLNRRKFHGGRAATQRRRADAALARAERAEKALCIVDLDARDHIRSDEIAPALLRPHALRAVRAALAHPAPAEET